MELFFEFLLTVALSIFCSFLLAKLLSTATANDNDHYFEKTTTHYLKFEPESKSYHFETERKFGFVSKIVGVDKLGESMENKFTQQELYSNEGIKSFFHVTEDIKTDVDLTEEGSREENGLPKFEENSITKSETETEMGLIKEQIDFGKSEINLEIEEEDDWEGIERSELEKLFGAAVAFVGSINNADKILLNINSDLKLKLHGLHQVAIEGPCHVPQPRPFKFSARSKWNAWQKLGNMSPEVAMEQYINLVSRSIPGWMKDNFEDQVRKLHA
ncbi:hypothetical protein JCGZ_12508 [Jatropha curcas]|uniref:ACB domain-containing protein n=2 Tax=Jatropha curcas TaxID=180498 RepID=A0A067K7E7_JATCU|nr:hypothetical protein JCGZ_12508 [Jatropha curcas]